MGRVGITLTLCKEMELLGIVILVLVALAVVLIAALHIWVYGSLWIGGMISRRRLRTTGRVMSLREAKSLISAGNGTLVADHPTLGWNVSRLWWAPSGMAVPRPDSWDKGRMCPPEDDLNYDRLLDPLTGEARLICPFLISQRVERFLQRHFGEVDCVYVFSGGVDFERALKIRQAQQGV